MLLPEGITGFGQELDTRFADSLQIITGSLPAQYGIRTSGVIDVQTKSGAFDETDELGLYTGSYNTFRPSFELAGTQGKVSYSSPAIFSPTASASKAPTARTTHP